MQFGARKATARSYAPIPDDPACNTLGPAGAVRCGVSRREGALFDGAVRCGKARRAAL